jgi:hypothetical protein
MEGPELSICVGCCAELDLQGWAHKAPGPGACIAFNKAIGKMEADV